jgi:hypothetical protein
MMTAREAAALLGGQATTATSLLCPGPGHSPRDRSLSVRLDPAAPDSFVVHSFSGDGPLVCRDHVRAALGLGLWRPRGDTPPAPRPRPTPAVDDVAGRIAAALRIWGEARPAAGTLAETYLRNRGLALDPRAAECIRFRPGLHFEGGTAPAMVGLFRDLRTDEPCGIHRTYLRPDGSKLGRKMLGRARGAAIKLDPDDEVALGLVVGEGIETCLAARMLGYKPTWVLGSATAIEHLPVLGGIEALTLLGENDATGTNARAVDACARRWLAAGREVTVVDPDAGDLNDVLRARASG